MYQLFDDIDIKNLKNINNLYSNQNMSIKQIRKHLLENKQEVLFTKESNSQVDKSVLNIFQQFANALMEQNRKIDQMNETNVQLVKTIYTLSKNQENIINNMKEQESKSDINVKNQSEQLIAIKKELALSKEDNKKITNKLENQEKNISIHEGTITKIGVIDMLIDHGERTLNHLLTWNEEHTGKTNMNRQKRGAQTQIKRHASEMSRDGGGWGDATNTNTRHARNTNL
jgi:hypothetical protein